MKLYLIRHGETDYNVEQIHQAFDTPLSENGIKQAHTLAVRLQSIPIKRILASPMYRAQTTAQILSEKIHIPIQEVGFFTEHRKPSQIQNKSHLSSEALSIKEEQNKHFHNKDYHYSDEENFFDFKERVLQGIRFIESFTDEDIALITHGAVFTMILGLFLYGEDFSSHDYQLIRPFFDVANTGVSTFYTSPKTKTGWKLDSWNIH